MLLSGNLGPLLPNEKRVVDFLRAEWEQDFRITTIQQAADALGLPGEDSLRLRVGRHLAADPGLNSKLERWGPVAFILTEEEKLLARCLQRQGRTTGALPSSQELSEVLGQSTAAVDAGLEILMDLGLLVRQADTCVLAKDFEEQAGALGFNFHTVLLESGERFNVA